MCFQAWLLPAIQTCQLSTTAHCVSWSVSFTSTQLLARRALYTGWGTGNEIAARKRLILSIAFARRIPRPTPGFWPMPNRLAADACYDREAESAFADAALHGERGGDR